MKITIQILFCIYECFSLISFLLSIILSCSKYVLTKKEKNYEIHTKDQSLFYKIDIFIFVFVFTNANIHSAEHIRVCVSLKRIFYGCMIVLLFTSVYIIFTYM